MLHETETRPDDIADEWAIRSEFWNAENANSGKTRKRRERNSCALILCGHGVSLRIENGALVIRDGFTHFPQTQVAYRYFRGDLDLPPRIVLLDGSGTLSFDVLSWLGEQNVALAQVKWTGEMAIVATGSGYIADRAKVDWQLATRSDEAARLAFSIGLIRDKLANCIETLEHHFSASAKRDRAIAKIGSAARDLAASRPRDLTELRAVEAVCASGYFGAWQQLALRWTGTKRRPVPAEWLSYVGRTSTANGSKPKNVNASHPLNAMLNYAYAVRTAQLRIDAIADGYDPTIGIMHHGRRGLPAYVFDMIEPERPKIDAAILEFVAERSFAAGDFVIRADGVCRLSPQLARAMATTIL
jgi:CRISPR-associated endonuclease Cas1